LGSDEKIAISKTDKKNQPTLENMIIKSYFGILILVVMCLCNLNAQKIPDNLLYEHERLYVNDLLVLLNHKILSVNDRLHESNRKMFLLDSANLVTDTMKTSSILDIIAISDTSFFITDFV